MSKKPPKTERIARMVGKTTFRDFREGFAQSLAKDSDMDIKMALGMAQSNVGPLAVKIMETRYASTLLHEDELRRAYDRELASQTRGRAAHVVAVQRISAALAIREFAGARNARSEVPRYAWLVRVRRETIDLIMDDCFSWLLEQCIPAVDAFNVAMGVVREKRRKRAA
jgi:hypothetical protein